MSSAKKENNQFISKGNWYHIDAYLRNGGQIKDLVCPRVFELQFHRVKQEVGEDDAFHSKAKKVIYKIIAQQAFNKMLKQQMKVCDDHHTIKQKSSLIQQGTNIGLPQRNLINKLNIRKSTLDYIRQQREEKEHLISHLENKDCHEHTSNFIKEIMQKGSSSTSMNPSNHTS